MTPRGAQRSAGFSLIEMLVSVAILSVLTVGASLAISRGDRSEGDLGLFQKRYDTALQLAITGQQSQGLEITARGVQSMMRGLDRWAPSGQRQGWRGRVSLRAAPVSLGGNAPDIVFLASGQTNAFRISFGTGAGCESQGWDGLTCFAR